MRSLFLITTFILTSCGSAKYALHTKPEHFMIRNAEHKEIASSNGIVLSYDRSPFVRVEGEEADGSVRIFYKTVLTNLSGHNIKLADKGIRLISGKKEVLAKYKKVDAKLLDRVIKNREKLELEVIFDLDKSLVELHAGKTEYMELAVKLEDKTDVKMKVWLWSL